MATLTNTQISVTYVGLLKTSGNTILDSTPQQITDGSGNNSQLFLSTTKVGVGATPSGSDTLQITGTSSFSSHITLADNAELRVGTSTDLQASHDGTDSFIINNTGDLYIRNNADDKDIIFQCDDGSGGVETYFFLDGSASSGNPFTVFPDLSELAFGTSRDLKIKHDGTDSSINNNTGDLYIKNSADDKDIIFQSDDGSGGVTSYFELDGSDVVTKFRKNLYLLDNVGLKIGNSFDLDIKHDGSDSFIANATGHLYIKNSADDKDIIFQSDDGSGGMATYFFLDGSQADGTYRYIDFPDNSVISLGDNDAAIFHDGTDTRIKNETGDLFISQFANDKDIVFRNDDGSGGVAEYFRLDGGLASGGELKTLFPDNSRIVFGDGADFNFYHDGTDSRIQNTTGHIRIINFADDSDIIFSSDDGSGGTTEYFRVDGSIVRNVFSKNVGLEDNVQLIIGSGNDLQILHDASDTFLLNNTGDLYLRNLADDKDIIFQSDDGSGGVATYFFLDGSRADGTYLYTEFPDNSVIGLGNDTDLQIYHSGTNSLIDNFVGDLIIQQRADDSDIIFSSDDGSGGTTEYFRVDGGVSYTVASKAFRFLDSVNVQLGDGADFTMQHNGTDTVLQNFTGDLKILNSADDKDIIFQSDDGSGSTATYMTIDGSATKVTLQKDLRADDGVKIQAGSSGDLFMVHESDTSKITNGTGQLQITQNVADEDIVFQADGGSGSAVEYMRLDGSQTSIRMKRQVKWDDNIKATFGNSDDLAIYHDGSNSFIQDSGTGRLNILTNQFRVLNSANSEILIDANENSAVDLYHNNVKKFATTSSGVEVTGFTDGSLADTGAGYNDGVVRFHNTTTATSGGSSVMNIRNSYGAGFGGLIKFWKADTSSSVGNIAFNTDTTAVNYNTTSDYRLKEDLQDFAGIDLIQRMKVYDYKWINYESRSYGVLAHELQEVLPGAVSGEKDDEEMQGVDYSKVVPVLIKAIQELKAEIELLKK